MAYRRPAETRKDRVNQAIANYAVRDNNTPIVAEPIQPLSGRFFVWYGWKDARRSGVFPKYTGKLRSLQCSHMFKNGNRCGKEVCLGTDLCVDHLQMIGISVTTKYKPNSRVVDTISRVYTNRKYNKDELVLRLLGEFLNKDDHIERYQIEDRAGPHEFGFKDGNNYLYVDTVNMSNEAVYMRVSADKKYKPNLKFKLDLIDYAEGNGIIKLHALQNIKAYESLVIHPTEGHNHTF